MAHYRLHRILLGHKPRVLGLPQLPPAPHAPGVGSSCGRDEQVLGLLIVVLFLILLLRFESSQRGGPRHSGESGTSSTVHKLLHAQGPDPGDLRVLANDVERVLRARVRSNVRDAQRHISEDQELLLDGPA